MNAYFCPFRKVISIFRVNIPTSSQIPYSVFFWHTIICRDNYSQTCLKYEHQILVNMVKNTQKLGKSTLLIFIVDCVSLLELRQKQRSGDHRLGETWCMLRHGPRDYLSDYQT